MCQSQYAQEINPWCHIVTSEFDGWAIGAVIQSPANRKAFSANSGTEIVPPSTASEHVVIYGGG
jgi:hypothetical protein